MIRTIIIDDEPFNRELLHAKLRALAPDMQVLAQCENGLTGLAAIEKHRPELVFLDVEMPLMNGLDMLRKISAPAFEVIFITAFNQYAINAIKLSALDYLLKPIDSTELLAALARYRKKRQKALSEAPAARIQNVLENFSQKQLPDAFKLAVASVEGTFFYKLEDVLRCQGKENYTWLFFREQKPVLASKTLREYEVLLTAHGFLRIHKSHLVNRRFVKNILPERRLLLTDGTELEIAKRRLAEVKAWIGAGMP